MPPGNSTDEQKIGCDDHLMHPYWHFIGEPYSAGAPAQPPKQPNALTEIRLLTDAIGTGESDDIKSYDMVWLEHLVGISPSRCMPLRGSPKATLTATCKRKRGFQEALSRSDHWRVRRFRRRVLGAS